MKINKILGVALATLMATASASAALAQEVTLKMGHGVFESHPFHDATLRFAAEVAEKSGGEIKIDIFPARQLGGVKELMEGVQLGTLDMTLNSSSALAKLSASMDAYQLPYVLRTYEDFARMAVSPESDAILSHLGQHGILGLGIYEGGQRHFLSTGEPVAALKEFAGLKTRVAPTELFLAVWNAAGVNPTPMAYKEVYSGMETGAIDAVEINLTSIESEKLYEAAKSVTLTGHYFWPGVMLINKDVFEGLSEKHQKILRDAAHEITAAQVHAVSVYEEQLKIDLAAKGVNITTASDAFSAELEAAFAPVVKIYTDREPLIAAFVAAAAAK